MNNFRKVPFNFVYNHLTSVTSSCCKRVPRANILSSINRFGHSYEGDGKTTANIINMQENLGLMIQSYSPHGFRLNNRLFIRGSMAIFPNTVLSWQVYNIDDINEDSLAIFPLLEPAIDILLVGVGDAELLTRERKAHIASIGKKFKIPMEILPTDTACTTFNFLVAESRFVGAVFIPQLKGYEFAEDVQKKLDEHGILS